MAPENNDLIVGSTMTPATMVTPKVVTKQIDTDRLGISGQVVDGISHTTEIPVSDQTKKLASIYALEASIYDTLRELDEIKNDLDNIYFSPVLSDPILDPFFVDPKWELDGFTRETSGIVFTRKAQATGYAKVLSDAFIKPGKYFVYLQVDQLTSGKLVVRDQSDNIIKEIFSTGTEAFEINIEQPTVDSIEFVATNVLPNESIRINGIYVHHVKNSFGRYVDFLVESMLTGGSGFASELYVQTMMNMALDSARSYTNSVTENINNDLTLHETTYNNPHQVTYVQTGAAAANHTHTPVSIDAADRIHTHNASEISGIAADEHTHTPDECGAAPTVHTHTPISIGAADRAHTHVPDECGAAATIHTHTLDNLVDIDTIYTALDELENQIASNNVTEQLDTHTSNYNNPHQVTKTHVELGQVVDAPMATPQETIDGILENRYVNPVGDRAALEAFLGTQTLDPTKLIPVPINKLVWDNANTIYTIPIFKDRLYRISINCHDTLSLKELVMAIDTTTGIDVVRNNICMAKKQTLTSGDILSYMGWENSLNNHFKFMLPSAGINKAQGELTLNSYSMCLTGIMHGYVLDETTGEELVDNSFPYLVSSGFKATDIPENITNLILYPLNAEFINAEILIYELIQPTQEPNMVIDATPVGTIVQRYGEQIIPGWSELDGSELSRIMYPEAWMYAQQSGYLRPENEWQADVVANNGTTYYFSTGNDTTTFRIPKIQPTGPLKTYMKTKYSQIQDSDEILYRFIWEN